MVTRRTLPELARRWSCQSGRKSGVISPGVASKHSRKRARTRASLARATQSASSKAKVAGGTSATSAFPSKPRISLARSSGSSSKRIPSLLVNRSTESA